ncbi:hypothetical protein HDV06_004511, partial [Boothiomyces sp. JEL0866]
ALADPKAYPNLFPDFEFGVQVEKTVEAIRAQGIPAASSYLSQTALNNLDLVAGNSYVMLELKNGKSLQEILLVDSSIPVSSQSAPIKPPSPVKTSPAPSSGAEVRKRELSPVKAEPVKPPPMSNPESTPAKLPSPGKPVSVPVRAASPVKEPIKSAINQQTTPSKETIPAKQSPAREFSPVQSAPVASTQSPITSPARVPSPKKQIDAPRSPSPKIAEPTIQKPTIPPPIGNQFNSTNGTPPKIRNLSPSPATFNNSIPITGGSASAFPAGPFSKKGSQFEIDDDSKYIADNASHLSMEVNTTGTGSAKGEDLLDFDFGEDDGSGAVLDDAELDAMLS